MKNSEALALITPVVLTYDEEANIGRTLECLRWAQRVVIVDSESTDETPRIAKSFANVNWFVRRFANHRQQWEYGINHTNITTKYVLALDADMQVTEALLQEITDVLTSQQVSGGLIAFDYKYQGKQLSASLCPRQLRLFLKNEVKIDQPHHTQRFSVQGKIHKFRNRLIHDDRKPLERWVEAQVSYVKLNANALQNGGPHRLKDRLRRWGVMPPLMGALAYLRAGGPLSGAAAARYAYERMTAESLLAIRLMDDRMKNGQS